MSDKSVELEGEINIHSLPSVFVLKAKYKHFKRGAYPLTSFSNFLNSANIFGSRVIFKP